MSCAHPGGFFRQLYILFPGWNSKCQLETESSQSFYRDFKAFSQKWFMFVSDNLTNSSTRPSYRGRIRWFCIRPKAWHSDMRFYFVSRSMFSVQEYIDFACISRLETRHSIDISWNCRLQLGKVGRRYRTLYQTICVGKVKSRQHSVNDAESFTRTVEAMVYENAFHISRKAIVEKNIDLNVRKIFLFRTNHPENSQMSLC